SFPLNCSFPSSAARLPATPAMATAARIPAAAADNGPGGGGPGGIGVAVKVGDGSEVGAEETTTRAPGVEVGVVVAVGLGGIAVRVVVGEGIAVNVAVF